MKGLCRSGVCTVVLGWSFKLPIFFNKRFKLGPRVHASIKQQTLKLSVSLSGQQNEERGSEDDP